MIGSTSAANLFSLVASCKLDALDRKSYLADALRVMAHWPRVRHLALALQYRADTRARLDDRELARPSGSSPSAAARGERRDGYRLTRESPCVRASW